MSFRLANKGMTLFEVLIALVILSFIGIAIYNALRQSSQLSVEMAAESDFYNEVRISLQILDRDITSLYSPLMMMPLETASRVQSRAVSQNGGQGNVAASGTSLVLTLEQANQALAGEGFMVTDYWTEIYHPSGIRASRFQGKEDSLSFIASDGIRLYKQQRQTEFQKVSYKIERNPEAKAGTPDADTFWLYRSISPNVFDIGAREDKLIKTYPILKGVKVFKFTYWQRDRNDGVKDWDSNSTEYRYRYPDYIELEIEVTGQRRRRFEALIRFRPELPLYGLKTSF